ncbi:MAG: GNAT family N-acetyltransferase [Solobacterium sp.]|nr:GNAT family N-acetyltransferase [Solobacterium sp.]
MPELIKPEMDELSFRKKMLENLHTMNWLGETIPFPKENWKDFYESHVLADPSEKYYRLIYCPGCNDFVGSIGYEFSRETNRYEMELLIDAGRRLCGYGRWALGALKNAAKNAGISSLAVRISKTNTAYEFLEKYGFSRKEEDGDSYLEVCEL